MGLLFVFLIITKGDPICRYSGSKMFVEGEGEVIRECVLEVPYDLVVTCEVGEGIRVIGEKAFDSCGKLQTINLPDTLLKIKKKYNINV